MATHILRMREVLNRIGVSRSTIYVMMGRGDFPPPLRLGSHSIGWRDSDIEEWIASRPVSPRGEDARPRRPSHRIEYEEI